MQADEKLRPVLDYLPCEACLATPSPEQELLCSLCRRLDRTIAIKGVTRTRVILERPEAEPEPVAIPPAPSTNGVESAPAEAEPEPGVEVVTRRRGLDIFRRGPPATEVVIEPMDAEAPEPAPVAVPVEEPASAEPSKRKLLGFMRRREEPEPQAQAEPEAAPVEEAPVEPEESWDDLASFDGTRPAEDEDEDDVYTYQAPARAEPEPVAEEWAPPEAPEPEEAPAPVEEPVLDPAIAEAADIEDEWLPAEEIPLEPPREEADPWARPAEEESSPWQSPPPEPEAVSEPEPEPETAPLEAAESEEVFEMEIVPDEAEPEEEILELEIIDDEPDTEAQWRGPSEPEPPVQAEPDPAPAYEPEPAPTPEPPAEAEPASAPAVADDSDLWRLDNLGAEARERFRAIGIDQLTHLSGHDATELHERTGIPRETLVSWLHVANLVSEVGVPIDGARALVQAGIEGPGALAALSVEDIVEQVELSGGGVTAREVKRWKRRA